MSQENVYRYEGPLEDNGLRGDAALTAAIEAHIAEHYGPESSAWRSPVSEGSPIQLRIVQPTPERPALTVVTVGMSERPMVDGDGDELWCELVIVLPPDWAFDHPTQLWPLLALEQLAHFPHEYGAYIGPGNTIQNPFPWSQSGLCGAMVADQVLAPSEAAEKLTYAGREIHFFGAWFLFEDEMRFKTENGTDALWDLLIDGHVTEAVDPDRASVAPRRRGLFGRRRR